MLAVASNSLLISGIMSHTSFPIESTYVCMYVYYTSGGAAVTGYTIYYQQEGGERSSVSAGASAISATISGLIEGATYTITVTANSNTLPSITTVPTSLVIGTAKNHYSSHPHVMTKLLTNCSHSCGSVHLTRCHGNCW